MIGNGMGVVFVGVAGAFKQLSALYLYIEI